MSPRRGIVVLEPGGQPMKRTIALCLLFPFAGSTVAHARGAGADASSTQRSRARGSRAGGRRGIHPDGGRHFRRGDGGVLGESLAEDQADPREVHQACHLHPGCWPASPPPLRFAPSCSVSNVGLPLPPSIRLISACCSPVIFASFCCER